MLTALSSLSVFRSLFLRYGVWYLWELGVSAQLRSGIGAFYSAASEFCRVSRGDHGGVGGVGAGS